jgi:hypothetical protein
VAGERLKDFNQARNAAMDWLERRGFRAELPRLGKFGPSKGKPVGMQYDERHGAHINVFSGKEKGIFTFEGNQSMVDQIVKQFLKE